MRAIGCMHTYNVNFLLKPFTNHLLLWFLYLQVITKQSISAKPVISCLFFLLVKQTHASTVIWESHKRGSAQMFSDQSIDKDLSDQFLSRITVLVPKQMPWENNYIILIVCRLLSGSIAIELLTKSGRKNWHLHLQIAIVDKRLVSPFTVR